MNQSKKTPVKTLLGWCGSMVVAIVLMALMMILLAGATFVENKYGASVSQFAIYRAWWFDVLLAIFGGNVLCAMLARLPWRWGHMPFVVAHLGVLILLIGCWVTSRYGLEAQLTVFEGELARFSQKVSGDEINIEIIDFRKQSGMNQSHDGNVAVEERSKKSEIERLTRERLESLRDKTKIKSPGLVLQPELDALAMNRHERISVMLGPLSWQDYNTTAWPMRPLLQLAKRSRGTIYNKAGIRVELLDYMADSRLKPAEQLQIRLQTSGFGFQDDTTDANPEARSLKPEAWLTRDLPLGQSAADARGNDPYLVMLPDERISYRLAKSNAETVAFLEMPKEQPSGTWGSVVMRVGGYYCGVAVDDLISRQAEFGGRINRTTRAKEDAELAATALRVQLLAPDEGVDVEAHKTQLAEKEAEMRQFDKELDKLNAQIRMHIGKTGLSVEMPRFDPDNLLMLLAVYREDGTRYVLAVGGDQPLNATVPDALGIQVMHLFDPETILNTLPGQRPTMPLDRAMKPRLDLLQGRDQRLYYRFWDGRKYASSGEMRMDQVVTSFEGHDGSTLKVAVEKFEPHDYPGLKLEPFQKPTGSKMQSVPCVKLRVCVDEVGDETYWVQKSVMLTPSAQLGEHQVGFIPGHTRTVAVTFPQAWLDLGFSLYLHKFERKLEPGISMPTHYSSLVSVFPIDNTKANTTDREPLYEQVLIRMNQPGMFADQITGRKYRVFQTSYQGPFHPGMEMYQMRHGSQLIEDETRPRESLYSSTLTANYDPGRGLKYLGSLMLVLGSLVFFYTRKGTREEGRELSDNQSQQRQQGRGNKR